jgi:hypothetical protein
VTWPAHLAKTRKYLLEAMKIMSLHGRMRCEPKPGTADGSMRITIVIDVPPPAEPGSDRARKKNHDRR